MSDDINNPDHYTWHPTGVEAIEIIEHFPHNVAAAMGYLWRHERKGEPLKDLRKAAWHIQREIAKREKADASVTRGTWDGDPAPTRHGEQRTGGR